MATKKKAKAFVSAYQPIKDRAAACEADADKARAIALLRGVLSRLESSDDAASARLTLNTLPSIYYPQDGTHSLTVTITESKEKA